MITSSWRKTVSKEMPADIWHLKGICSWCVLRGKGRLLSQMPSPCYHWKQHRTRKVWLFSWARKQKEVLNFREEGCKFFHMERNRPTSSFHLRKADGVGEIPTSWVWFSPGRRIVLNLAGRGQPPGTVWPPSFEMAEWEEPSQPSQEWQEGSLCLEGGHLGGPGGRRMGNTRIWTKGAMESVTSKVTVLWKDDSQLHGF